MFVCCFITVSCLMSQSVSASQILRSLLGEDLFFKMGFPEDRISGVNSNDLIRLLSELPITTAIKTEAWYYILRYRTPESLHLTDWRRYEQLLPYLPYTALQSVNFSDDGILTYFGQQQHTELGPPRTWEPETVRQAGSLMAGLDATLLKEIRTRSFSEVSLDVIRLIPQEVLKEVKNSQLRVLSQAALMAWRRKTQDLRQINGSEALVSSLGILVLIVACAWFLIN